MRKHHKYPFLFSGLYAGILTLFSLFVLADTFLIPRGMAVVEEKTSGTFASLQTTQDEQGDNTDAEDTTAESVAEITESSYKDENIEITIDTLRVYDSDVYVARIQLSSIAYLRTALANDTYGRNITQTTSEMAEEHNAILAINGDYYGFRDSGYVLRNGTLYRNSVGDEASLVIDREGNFTFLEDSLDSLNLDNIWQILSFGPSLIEDGTISVGTSDEVEQAKKSNPRTAVGEVASGEYIFLVSDGRTDESEGLSLYEVAEILQTYGCTQAYNLDGGGSSTMVFQGEVVNQPSDGRTSSERAVSDIVYIGYE